MTPTCPAAATSARRGSAPTAPRRPATRPRARPAPGPAAACSTTGRAPAPRASRSSASAAAGGEDAGLHHDGGVPGDLLPARRVLAHPGRAPHHRLGDEPPLSLVGGTATSEERAHALRGRALPGAGRLRRIFAVGGTTTGTTVPRVVGRVDAAGRTSTPAPAWRRPRSPARASCAARPRSTAPASGSPAPAPAPAAACGT